MQIERRPSPADILSRVYESSRMVRLMAKAASVPGKVFQEFAGNCWQAILIRDLPIPVRAKNALLRASITSLREFVQEPLSEKLNIQGVGAKTLDRIIIGIKQLVPFWQSLPLALGLDDIDLSPGAREELARISIGEIYQMGVVGLLRIAGIGIKQAEKILDVLYPIPPEYLSPRYESRRPIEPMGAGEKLLRSVPPFDIHLPGNTPAHIGPVDVLAGLIAGLSHKITPRTRKRLSDVTNVSDFFLILDGKLPRPEMFRKKSLADLRLALKAFIEHIKKKPPQPEGGPLVIKISQEDLDQYLKKPQRLLFPRKANRAAVVAFIQQWRTNHPPGSYGAQSAAAREFDVSRELIRRILIAERIPTARSLTKQSRSSITTLAHQLETDSRILRRLLSRAGISVGRSGQLPTASLTEQVIAALKVGIMEESWVSQVMESLNRYQAGRLQKKGVIFPLSQILKPIGFGRRKDIPLIFRALKAARFHPQALRTPRGYLYFVHKEEIPDIIKWLQEYYISPFRARF